MTGTEARGFATNLLRLEPDVWDAMGEALLDDLLGAERGRRQAEWLASHYAQVSERSVHSPSPSAHVPARRPDAARGRRHVSVGTSRPRPTIVGHVPCTRAVEARRGAPAASPGPRRAAIRPPPGDSPTPMSETTAPADARDARPAWFDACLIGSVFAVVVLPAGGSLGLGMLVLNLAALACFVAPVVAWVKGRDGG